MIAPVATRLRLSLGQMNDDAIAFRTPVDRVMFTMTTLKPAATLISDVGRPTLI